MVEDLQHARTRLQQGAPILHRTLSGSVGELVEHAFDDKAVARFADASPIADQQTAGWFTAHKFDAMIGPFVRARSVAYDVEVDTVLREGRQEPGHDGGADDTMLETGR